MQGADPPLAAEPGSQGPGEGLWLQRPEGSRGPEPTLAGEKTPPRRAMLRPERGRQGTDRWLPFPGEAAPGIWDSPLGTPFH